MPDFFEPNVIPSAIHSSATKGEKRIHNLLKRLPDECISYYEPYIDDRRPDFVILCPELGILVIEDKSWFPETIVGGDRNRVDIRPRGNFESSKVINPQVQVRDYQFRLSDKIARDPLAKDLKNRSGIYQGNLRFPMTHLVTLPNITSTQFHGRNLTAILDPKRVVTRDRIEWWETLSGEELIEEFRRFFDPFWQFAPLTVEEINVLRSVINPQLVFGREVSEEKLSVQDAPLNEQTEAIVTLDRRQEDVAISIGEGHRILYGVAGSGKTLLLMARARAISAKDPNARILLVCYNKCLADWMQKNLADRENVTISTFHSWGSANGVAFIRNETEGNYGKRFLKALESDNTDKRCFDCVLVDEAQDFDKTWFRCIIAAMKNPEDGDLLIVADRAQQIYSRQKFTWSSVGIKARGRSHSKIYDLDRNYRNSTEILALAETLATKIRENFDEGEMPVGGIDLKQCVRSTGAAPVLWCESSLVDELSRVAAVVEKLMGGDWRDKRVAPLRPNQIGILLPALLSSEKELVAELKAKLESELGIRVRYSKGGQTKKYNNDALSIQTVHSAKGLQFRAVIMPGVDKLFRKYGQGSREDKIAEARQLMYVGATRAESFLALTASAISPVLEDLLTAPSLEVIGRERFEAKKQESATFMSLPQTNQPGSLRA